jgi:hypothetical protein
MHHVRSWFAPIVAYVFCTPFCALVRPLPYSHASLYGLGHRSPCVRKNPIVLLYWSPCMARGWFALGPLTALPLKKGGQAQPLGITTRYIPSCLALFPWASFSSSLPCNHHPPKMAGVWVSSYSLNTEGFPKILFATLQKLGVKDHPEYEGWRSRLVVLWEDVIIAGSVFITALQCCNLFIVPHL